MIQLQGVSLWLGDGAAMTAGQRARTRYLPEEDERALGKITHRGMVRSRHARIVHARARLGKSLVCLLYGSSPSVAFIRRNGMGKGGAQAPERVRKQ